jgi:GT2 family glycosyltransferase
MLSIIIINYNTFQLTLNCIRSIVETTEIEYEILLIDNNSKECNPQLFLDFFPLLRLMELKENVGFARANNIGMKNAKGDYILLLNSDTIVQRNTINETVGFLKENKSVDIIGCKSVLENGITQKTVYEYYDETSLIPSLKYLFKHNTIIQTLLGQVAKRRKSSTSRKKMVARGEDKACDENYQHEKKRIGFLMGVFLLFKRSVYENTKGFDPDFFMYHEEKEWFLNRLRNYNIMYYPKASIIHYHGKSDVYNKMNLQHHVSDYLFWYKMGYAQFSFFILYNLIEIPSRILLGTITMDRFHFKNLAVILKSLSYIGDIIRYPNKYGSRKEMLKIKYLKKNQL